ncbi:chemotaxis protein [Vibrio sp. 10N.286.49.C2]|uniref:methyl-accepting chemotaxis protein n=1 Tax=unclassified Vibrio TaxID=2614977 RepID=UPI000C83FAC0|nr:MULTISPECIES: methyl-accepting chemotaxis protein [unclassified Vibrio]PMH38986.1 chemotaxis protein [Vibrio sp. 10N.286.49.C2]PMH55461.1 chemotaxis protein [Vibrio sp. 10N.286.49.B1]PMH78888.1 chemotaxis protein [Vibrio sp. 10N.286.48.B7]
MTLSVKNKLYGGFLAIFIVMCSGLSVIWFEVSTSEQVAMEINQDDVPELEQYLILIDEIGDVYRSSLEIVLGDNAALASYRSNIDSAYSAINLLKGLELGNQADTRRLEEVSMSLKNYTEGFESQVMIAASNSRVAVNFDITKHLHDQYLAPIEKILDKASISEKQDTYSALRGLIDSFSLIYMTIIISAIAVIVGSLLVSYFLSNSIVRRVSVLNNVAQRIANGDLSSDSVVDNASDELSSLAQSINKMQRSLAELISSIHSVSVDVKEATCELAAVGEKMVVGASSQSDKATLIATASEELSLTISEVATQSNQTYSEAQRSESCAIEGRSVISDMVQSVQQVSIQMEEMSGQMNNLGAHGKQIGSVIKVIQDIAEQTNLLALNAAIEAARAGEFGRGFAVVADEVRALAERTTRATQEVSVIIQSIQSGTQQAVSLTEDNRQLVESGVKQSEGAISALEQIVGGASHVQTMINSIATAAEEQTAVTKEIATDISSISDISDHTLEQASFSAMQIEGLNSKVNELDQLVARFKL